VRRGVCAQLAKSNRMVAPEDDRANSALRYGLEAQRYLLQSAGSVSRDDIKVAMVDHRLVFKGVDLKIWVVWTK